MAKTIEAVYEGGVFIPLEPVKLNEGDHVRIPVEEEDDPIELAGRVYDGLSEDEIAEIEKIALDRSGWRRT